MAHVFQRDGGLDASPTGTARAGLAADTRVIARSFGFILLTVVLFGIWLLVAPFLLPVPKIAARWRGFMFCRWARGMVRLLGMRLKVSGKPPRAPFLLVANHLSYVDAIVMGSQLKNCVFVAKSEIAGWFGIGLIGRLMRNVFIDRSNARSLTAALQQIAQAQADGSGVVLFPEGTSTPGATVARFKSSLLADAARAQSRVYYATLTYRTPQNSPPAHLAVCWWGDMTFGRHLLALFRLPEFTAEITFGAQPIVAAERKELAGKLHAAVAAQFAPVVGVEAL